MPAVTRRSVGAARARVGRPARPVQSIVTAQATFEGAGFPVHRPFPQPGADLGATDPFLMLDEMGPIDYGPGEAGAPDHPHRGFETVTYLFDGEMEHRDSTGGGGLLRGGDTQWMTAGAGLVHSEEPTEAMLRDGGLMHGMQLWVNLPRADKLTPPRYQDLSGDKLTLARSRDGRRCCGSSPASSAARPVRQHAHADRLRARDDRRRRAARARWPAEYNALVYVVVEGTCRGDDPHRRRAPARGARTRRRRRRRRGGRNRRRDPARRPAAARARRLVRTVRDEHEAGDRRLARPLRAGRARRHPAQARLRPRFHYQQLCEFSAPGAVFSPHSWWTFPPRGDDRVA